jgi:methionyl-tRNA formyltransferase
MILEALAGAGKTVAGVVVEPRSSLILRDGVCRFLKDSWRRHGVMFLWQRAVQTFRHALGRRGSRLHEMCAQFGIPHRIVQDHNSSESEALIHSLDPDVLITANTRILRESIIGLGRLAAVNLHTGKLPEYAGLESIFWALYQGETEIGVTVHYLARGLDAGDILLQRLIPVGPGGNLESLARKAHSVGSQLVVEVVDRFEQGKFQASPQDATRRARFSWPTPAQRRELNRRLKRMNHGMPGR